jgi:phospholipase/carboxylesterase
MLVINSQENPKVLVIWLHGLGADSSNFKDVVGILNLLDIEFILPDAPLRPITMNQGILMRGWYDIKGTHKSIDFNYQDDAGLISSMKRIEGIITERIKQLNNKIKIILVGFSQGAALAIFTGKSSKIKFDGIISLSGYQPITIGSNPFKKNIPILAMHGLHDDIIDIETARLSYKDNSPEYFNFKTYEMGHEVIDSQLLEIQQFLLGIIDYD